MLRRRLLAATALTALLAVPFLAEAAPGRGGSPGDVLRNPKALARYLKLTAAQIETHKQLVQELRDAVKPLHDQLKPLHDQLRAQLDAASPDACAVGGTLIQIEGVRDQIQEAHEDFDEAFSAILTPEQLARYKALKDAARIGEEEGN